MEALVTVVFFFFRENEGRVILYTGCSRNRERVRENLHVQNVSTNTIHLKTNSKFIYVGMIHYADAIIGKRALVVKKKQMLKIARYISITERRMWFTHEKDVLITARVYRTIEIFHRSVFTRSITPRALNLSL